MISKNKHRNYYSTIQEEKLITPEVFELLRCRSEAVFDLIYDIYKRTVHAILYDYTKDLDATRDLCQDVFVRFWSMRRTYLNVVHLRRSVYRIARCVAIDFLRKNKLKAIFTDSIDIVDPTNKSLIDMTLEFKEALNDSEYTVMVLIIINGVSKKDAAEVLGMTSNQLYAVYHRGIKKLRNYYNSGEYQVVEDEQNGKEG